MQISIAKLAGLLIALLITVTVITTGTGLYVLQSNYQTLETRQEAEALDTVRNAAIAVRNQVQFYQGILHLMANNPEVGNLLEFGESQDMTDWSLNVARVLPGSLGTALVSQHGVVFGDPLAQRIGDACQNDMRKLSHGEHIGYPLLHTDVAGLEHFDLLTTIVSPSGETAGSLFVSFRLSVIEDLLKNMTRDGDQFELRDAAGSARLVTGATAGFQEPAVYSATIPETEWQLVLRRPGVESRSYITEMLATDIAILTLAAIVIIYLVRRTLWRFKSDMSRVHSTLADVLAGRYQYSDSNTSIKETQILLSDIQHLALKIQTQRDELRHQSLSDPLTGVFNRRYFDLMLAHLHEQSRRQRPSILVIIDLNDFKHINDEFGHHSGDRVLRNTAAYLRSRIRATDIVARLGGDEFALILTNMLPEALEEWLTALIHDYDHQLMENSTPSVDSCQFSIGAAYIDADVYATPADVFDAADTAMYAIKQRRSIRHSRFAVARPDPDKTAKAL